MTTPFRVISCPLAWSGNSTCARPVTASGYARPSRTVVTTVIRVAVTRWRIMMCLYASPRLVITTSMILMPMNGATMPPSP